MWFKIKSYLTFLLKSTNHHGVHSPFVYNLVSNCFYAKTNPTKKEAFQKIKKRLAKNSKVIEVTDFGKGSKIFKTNQRKVTDIAKIAGISKKRALLLIRICAYFKFENMLEIGTSVGLSTSALSIGNPTAKITTLEGCKKTSDIAKELFSEFNLLNIEQCVGNFKETLPSVLKNNSFDFVYFDGNHQKEATLVYFNNCLETAHNNSVFIFDDINWSVEMQQAWEIIKRNPKITITIDTFYWGFVFFRKEQKKEHFTLRI